MIVGVIAGEAGNAGDRGFAPIRIGAVGIPVAAVVGIELMGEVSKSAGGLTMIGAVLTREVTASVVVGEWGGTDAATVAGITAWEPRLFRTSFRSVRSMVGARFEVAVGPSGGDGAEVVEHDVEVIEVDGAVEVGVAEEGGDGGD